MCRDVLMVQGVPFALPSRGDCGLDSRFGQWPQGPNAVWG